jgi:hypothetical protein
MYLFLSAMEGKMLTPSQISVKPVTTIINVPSYDFESQRRWDQSLMAGKFTFGSIQTFDPKGQPQDRQNDNND